MSTSDASDYLPDYDSSSSLEIVVNPKKLREELEREDREEIEAVSNEKENNEHGKVKKSGVRHGRVGDVKGPMSRVQRIEREMKKRKMMKAQVMKNMAKHLEKPYVREAYNYFKRDIPAENDLNSDKTRKLVRVSADENYLSVTIFRRSPLPY